MNIKTQKCPIGPMYDRVVQNDVDKKLREITLRLKKTTHFRCGG